MLSQYLDFYFTHFCCSVRPSQWYSTTAVWKTWTVHENYPMCFLINVLHTHRGSEANQRRKEHCCHWKTNSEFLCRLHSSKFFRELKNFRMTVEDFENEHLSLIEVSFRSCVVRVLLDSRARAPKARYERNGCSFWTCIVTNLLWWLRTVLLRCQSTHNSHFDVS